MTVFLIYFIVALIVLIFNFIIYIRSWQSFLRDNSFLIETRRECYRKYFCSFEHSLSNAHFCYVENLNNVFTIAIIWPAAIVALTVLGIIYLVILGIYLVIDCVTKCRNHIIVRIESFMFSGVKTSKDGEFDK
jgi:hypothetical protein